MKKCNFATDTFDKIMEGRIVEFKPVLKIKNGNRKDRKI